MDVSLKVNRVRGARGRFIRQTAFLQANIQGALEEILQLCEATKNSVFAAQGWPPPQSHSYRDWKIRKGYGDMTYKMTGHLLGSMSGSVTGWNTARWGIMDSGAAGKMGAGEGGAGGRIPRPFFSVIRDTVMAQAPGMLKSAVIRTMGHF